MACEEMVARYKHQFLGSGGLGHYPLQSLMWAVLVVIAADEELRLLAIAQKRVGVQTAFGFNRSSDRN